MLTIVVGTDESGSMPVLLREEDALPGGPFHWRLIAQTDDEALAEGVMALMARRCYSDAPDAI